MKALFRPLLSLPSHGRLWALSSRVASALLLAASACAPDTASQEVPSAGTVVATPAGEVIEFRVSELVQPLRSLQVAVELEGAQAVAVRGRGEPVHDIVEAGLASGPRSRFNLVISDSRRLLINEGTLAEIELDALGQLTLGEALAVDDAGKEVRLDVRVDDLP